MTECITKPALVSLANCDNVEGEQDAPTRVIPDQEGPGSRRKLVAPLPSP